MLGGLFCAIVAPLLFDWAYEHPLLILAAALLVPQYALVPWPKAWSVRCWASRCRPSPSLLSYAVEAGLLGRTRSRRDDGGVDRRLADGAWPASAGAGPFAACLAALMLSYGGWGTTRYSRRGHPHPLLFRNLRGQRPRLETASAPGADPRHHPARHPESRARARDGADHLLCPPLGRRARARAMPTRCSARTRGSAWSASAAARSSCYAAAQPAPGPSSRSTGDGRGRAHPLHLPLASCAPQARIVLGDARLSLARRQPGQSLDVLAVDAFSSDAVPMHLLTREALRVYGRAVQRERHRSVPHLQPLSRPQAGDRRSRRARGLDGAMMAI